MSPSDRRSLDALAEHLPFAFTDVEAVTRTFERWHATRREDDLQTVQLWAYVYVHWYVLTTIAHQRGTPSEFEDLRDRAYTGILEHLDDIRQPDRFVHYVRVTCKNRLRNHWRDRRLSRTIDDDEPRELADPSTDHPMAEGLRDHDALWARRLVSAAIDALPESIREPTRLRVLDGLPYDTIAQRLGRPEGTVLTYARRGIARLRDDPRVQALLYDDQIPDTTEPHSPRDGPREG